MKAVSETGTQRRNRERLGRLHREARTAAVPAELRQLAKDRVRMSEARQSFVTRAEQRVDTAERRRALTGRESNRLRDALDRVGTVRGGKIEKAVHDLGGKVRGAGGKELGAVQRAVRHVDGNTNSVHAWRNADAAVRKRGR